MLAMHEAERLPSCRQAESGKRKEKFGSVEKVLWVVD